MAGSGDNETVAASAIPHLLADTNTITESLHTCAKMNDSNIIIPAPENDEVEHFPNNDVKDKDEVKVEVKDDQTARLRLMEHVVKSGCAMQSPSALPSPEALGIKLEWLGTSLIYLDTGMEMQLQVCSIIF